MFDFLKKKKDDQEVLECSIKFVRDENGMQYASIPQLTKFLEEYKSKLNSHSHKQAIDLLDQLINNFKTVENYHTNS